MHSYKILGVLLIILVYSCCYHIAPFHRTILRSNMEISLRLADKDDEDIKDFVKNSECIILIPLRRLTLSEVAQFRKAMPAGNKALVVKADKMLEAVDGTGFCHLGQNVFGSIFIVFVFKDFENTYDCFTKWVRQLTKDGSHGAQSEFVIGKKDHVIRFISNDSDLR